MTRKKNVLPYNEAKKLIKGQFTCRREFWDWYKKNNKKTRIGGEQVYQRRGEWVDWGDFLGTGYIATYNRQDYYWSFTKSKKYVRSLKLKGQQDWERWNRENKRPDGLPMAFSKVYEKEWKGWADFIGNGNERLRSPKLNFDKAKQYARKLNLKTSTEWYAYVKTHKIPNDIPKDPFDLYYRIKTWTTWNDFLGSGIVSTKVKQANFISFNESRKYARSLKLKTSTGWFEIKKPDNIPTQPNVAYHSQWKGWGDFLGSDKTRDGYLSFDEAKKYLLSLSLSSVRNYLELFSAGKIKVKLPYNLDQYYSKFKEFKGVADMIGTFKEFNYVSYEKARKIMKKMEIKTQYQFYKYRKAGLMPLCIPSNPSRVYEYMEKQSTKHTNIFIR